MLQTMLPVKTNYAVKFSGRLVQYGRHIHFNLLFSASDNHTLCKDDSNITTALH